ncbi:D-2-hydroxyacid dehydrogenase [Mesorhizobium sp. WSM3868]|uniref:D-2-hydroxyacid dehydrogenase n=1 Tax=Mesorhizobium sp. WSM3868 TaxID=2029405 RepID=UPI001FE080BE|nr:D-2-hydroxyacid dehydrogenase [Mesorhizobium sp. WSM3868]
MAEADILLAPSFPVKLVSKARRLKWFQCTNAGIDTVLPIRDQLNELIITNARGVHGELIADYVIAGITMLHWDFPRFMREQARKEWRDRSITLLAEQTLGVVGLGSIGAAIARRAKGAGMRVIGCKRDVTEPVPYVDELLPSSGLEELLTLSDFVVLAVPRIPETERLIGRAQFRQMRRTAFLVNIARGAVVAESELIEALVSGEIAGALLDVFEQEPLPAESPLWTMPNVIVTPHVAGWRSDYDRRTLDIFSENIHCFLEDPPLQNVIDLSRGC